MYDVLITGGTIVDGTGARRGAPMSGSATAGSSRSARSPARRARRSTPTGRIVAPGFVDVHTHYDAQVFWDPTLTPVLLPRRDDRARRLLRLLDRAAVDGGGGHT